MTEKNMAEIHFSNPYALRNALINKIEKLEDKEKRTQALISSLTAGSADPELLKHYNAEVGSTRSMINAVRYDLKITNQKIYMIEIADKATKKELEENRKIKNEN